MTNPIDPRRLHDHASFDSAPTPMIRQAGPRATYNVSGASVRAATQFRMVGGFNNANAGYANGRFDVNNIPQVKELIAAAGVSGDAQRSRERRVSRSV